LNRFFLTYLFAFTFFNSYAQKDSTQPRLFIEIETGLTGINSQGSETLICYQGQLGLSYRLFSQFRTGIYGQTLQYYQNLNIANIDNKIIELGSIDYYTMGLFLAYRIPLKKIGITPKLDLGYNIFNAKALDYDIDNKSFLDYRYLSVTPKISLDYQCTPNFALGIFGGYNLQLTALKGQKIETFDPNNYIFGLGARIGVGR
jgi:hypothetical protein